MYQIPVQVDGGSTSLSAIYFNSMAAELMNVITNTGQTLNGADSDQITQSLANFSSAGDWYIDSGTDTAYVLSPISGYQGITSYVTGQRFRFIPSHSNTGACTANINTLGVLNIVLSNGQNPQAGDLSSLNASIMYYNGTNLILENPQLSVATPWAPWYITGFDISPGTSSTTEFNVTSGNCRDQSGLYNVVASTSLSNKSIAATWAEGASAGSVVSAAFPFSSGDTIYVFGIWKADGVTFDYASTNDSTGANILADPTISGAGFVICRRVAYLYADGTSTMAPMQSHGGYYSYTDDITSRVVQPSNSTTPQLITLPVPAKPVVASINLSVEVNTGSTQTAAIYAAYASEPTLDTSQYYQAFDNDNGRANNANIQVLLDNSTQVYIVMAVGNNNSNVYVNGWWDSRTS